MPLPTLHTDRLILRPFVPGDAGQVAELAGDRLIADTTLNIPHPYEEPMAVEWISGHADGFRAGANAVFAISRSESSGPIGAIGLTVDERFSKAELGYWIGRPYWNNGFATEAAHRLVDYGFAELKLNRIAAQHLVRNPASGRVMQKIGMRHEGTLRQGTVKWGIFEDLEIYAILRSECVQSGGDHGES